MENEKIIKKIAIFLSVIISTIAIVDFLLLFSNIFIISSVAVHVELDF